MAKRGKDGLLVYKKNDNAKCRYSLPSNLLYLIKFIGKFDKTFLAAYFYGGHIHYHNVRMLVPSGLGE